VDRDRVVRRHARHLRCPVLLVLLGAVLLSLGLAVGSPPRAVAAPLGQPPELVGLTPDVARAAIKVWRPADGSVAVPIFTPATPPDVTDPASVLVVRQGAPIPAPVQGAGAPTTQVPLTLGTYMPRLRDGTRSAAMQLLDRAGLTTAVTWKPAGAGEGDIVTGQSPPEDTLVAFADPVVVSFTRDLPVPNVYGLSRKEASRVLVAAGFAPESTAATGRVVDQVPEAQALAPRGSPVMLTLEPGVTVPNVVGLTVDEARQAIEQAGLVLSTPRNAGLVTHQRPVAGSPARPGKVVRVAVEALPGIVVPNVVGKTVDEARETLDQVGLRLDAPSVAGRIVGQRPAAGALVFAGSTVAVTITVSTPWHRWLLIAAVVSVLLIAGVASVLARRWRRRRWIAQHVRVAMTRDVGVVRRRGGGLTTQSWRITVVRRPGPVSEPSAKEVTHADR
jgi:beta-lactam-binding protein with PASTA domain